MSFQYVTDNAPLYVTDNTTVFGIKYIGPINYVPCDKSPFGVRYVGEKWKFDYEECPFVNNKRIKSNQPIG